MRPLSLVRVLDCIFGRTVDVGCSCGGRQRPSFSFRGTRPLLNSSSRRGRCGVVYKSSQLPSTIFFTIFSRLLGAAQLVLLRKAVLQRPTRQRTAGFFSAASPLRSRSEGNPSDLIIFRPNNDRRYTRR